MSSERRDESGTDAAGDAGKGMWCLDAGLAPCLSRLTVAVEELQLVVSPIVGLLS